MIGSIEAKNPNIDADETSSALFETFFAGHKQDFFLLSALAYDNQLNSKLGRRYFNVYKLAKRIDFLSKWIEDISSYHYEEIPFQYEFLSLTFDNTLYMPLSKLMMAESVYGRIILQIFFLINPKLQILFSMIAKPIVERRWSLLKKR